jgi:hypothetical protein
MALTLAQMASRVLRDVEIPEDSSTSGVQALADAKQYLNEAAQEVHGKRLWREYLILGTYAVPASTKRIGLSDIVVSDGFSTSGYGYNAEFMEIAAIREGSDPILPEDAGAISLADPTAWTQTSSPVKFVNCGQNGIYLLGEYSTATTLSFMGKAKFQDLTDNETWVMAGDLCIMALAASKMLRSFDRDDGRANMKLEESNGYLMAMIDQAENQGGNLKRFVPVMPFTDTEFDPDISTTGTTWH